MTTYIVRRLITSLFVLILVTLIVFFVLRLLPGDPVLVYLSQANLASLTPAQIATVKAEFGLDKPLIQQYLVWMRDLLHGDFGKSLFLREDVSKLIAERLPITLNITLLAFILNIPLGIGAGMICALKRGRWQDTLLSSSSVLGVCIPIFWLGILFIYFFGLKLHWLPIYGYTSPFVDFNAHIRQLILPLICVMLYGLASAARQTRSAVLEVINQDYIRTAWSKGLSERIVVLRHVLKPSLLPVLTLKGISLGHIIGGNVLIEMVFNIPGMARLSVEAVLAQDYTIVQAMVLIAAVMVIITNLLVDIAYGWLDPRIRYG
jgi:peptide/nickel transport system permease protein